MKAFSRVLSAVREISVDDLARQPQLRIIDVRQPAEFHGDLGHIPNAELVPLQTIQRASRGWDRNEPIAVVGRSGARSMQAAQMLLSAGFENVLNVSGGTMAWRQRHAAQTQARA